MDQEPFDVSIFVENPEPRCPCVLLLDKSYSMSGEPIQELNNGLLALSDELRSDDLAMKRVELAIVSFGPLTIDADFISAHDFYPPTLEASQDTPMGAAINVAIDKIEERKQNYKSSGIAYYRPWIFLITDGAPTDDWRSAASRVREGEDNSRFAFFPIGVQGANMSILGQIATREPIMLQGLKFTELFQWLSQSLKTVSRSRPDDQILLPPPSGWGQV